MKTCKLICLITIFFCFFRNGFSQETVELSSIDLGDLKVAGFSLETEKYVNIDAEGTLERRTRNRTNTRMADPNRMLAYAWILDAKSRQMIWRMTQDNTSRSQNSRSNRVYSKKVKLPAGEYELYFSALPPFYTLYDDGFFSLGRLFEKFFGDKEEFNNDSEKWFIRISGVDQGLGAVSIEKYHNALKSQSVVSLTDLKDSDFHQEGFRLTEKGKFEIYSVGEGLDQEVFDYGWIIDASSSEKVWESNLENSKYAGGAEKNREWRKVIELYPGDYWVYYKMDDSHSPGNWNGNPPYDPDFYGLTMTGVENQYNPNSIEKLMKVEVKPIVALTKIENDEFVSEGFKINEPMRIRIYALGEGRRGRMYDYGWITNTNTGEKVWEMEFDRTRNAGGAEKNRLIDEIIFLPKGSYLVQYKSDDSHGYSDWNSPIPYNPDSWGITVYPADPKFTGKEVEKLEESMHESDIVAQIVRVGNGNHIQKRFELKQEARIRIYAIGEGDWDEMYDYGWIENEKDGLRIWEMTYQKTRWAGGAKKNRKVEQTIMLDKGSYILHFKKDVSHDYSDWNAEEPDDPVHYGITLYERENE